MEVLLGIFIFVIIVLGYVLVNTIRAATMIMYEGMMSSALLSNFSRFGDIDPERLVVIDDSRGYFVRDNALWTCEVKDDYIVQSTVKVVDVMSIKGEELKEVMTAVDALNSTAGEDEDDE